MAEIQDNKIVTYDDISTKLNEHQSTSNECPPKEDIVNTYVTVSKEPYGTELVPYADNQCVQYKDIVLGLVDITIQQSAGGTISVVYDGVTYTSGTFKALAGRELQIKTTYHATDANYKIIWWDGDNSQNRVWTVTGPTVIRADYYQFNTNTSTATKSYDANNFTLNITSIKNTVAHTYQVNIPDWVTVTKNSSNVVFNLTANTALDDRVYTIVYTQDESNLTGSFTLTQGGRRTYVKWGDPSNISGVSKEGASYNRPLVYSSTYSSTTGYYNKQALVASSAGWLTYSDPTITVAKNEYAAIETGVLTLTNNSIEGLVPQGDIDIQVQRLGRTRQVSWNSTSTWSPSNTANTTTRAITYTGDYIAGKFEPVARVSSSEEWCHVSLSGTTVTISVDTNVIGCSQPSRNATITLLVGGEGQDGLSISGAASWTVSQALWQTNCSFSTNTTNLSWSTSGGTSYVTVTNSDGSTTSNWEVDTSGLNSRFTATKTSNTQITVTALNSISSTALTSSFKIRQLGCCSNEITINVTTAAWAKTKNSVLTISPTSWSPSKYGASQSFTVTSYIDIYTEGTNGEYVRNYPSYTYSKPSWVSMSGDTATASDNSDGDYRSGTITVNNGYKTASCSVYQDGASYEFSSRYSVSPGCSAGSSDYTEIISTKNGNSWPWTMTTGTASGWSASPSSGSNGTRLTITNNNCNNGGSDYVVLTQQNSGLTVRVSWTNSSGCCCEGYYTYTVYTNTPGATVKFGSYATVTANSSGVATYERCGSVGCITVTVSKSGYKSQSGSVCADSSWTISGGLSPDCYISHFDFNPTSLTFSPAGGQDRSVRQRSYINCAGSYDWVGKDDDSGLSGSSTGIKYDWLTEFSMIPPNSSAGQDPSDYTQWYPLVVTAKINKSTSARSGTITIWNYAKSGIPEKNKTLNFTVRQEANSYSFFITESGATTATTTFEANGSGGSQYWPVSQDKTGSANWPKWFIKSNSGSSWNNVKIWNSASEGSNGTQLQINPSTNTSTSSRSSTVVLEQRESGKQCTITINQKGATVTGPTKIRMEVYNKGSRMLYNIQCRIAGAITCTGNNLDPQNYRQLSPDFEVEPNTTYTFTIYASTTSGGTPIVVAQQDVSSFRSGNAGTTTQVQVQVSL